jgi:predicted Zn-dependent protease
VAAVATAVVGLLLVGAVPAEADYSRTGMNRQSFCVQNPSVNQTWLNALNAGRNAWNNNPSFPGTISLFSGCTSTMRAGSYGQDWLGQYNPQTVGVQYQISLDSANLAAHIKRYGYTFANVVQSTTAHEFGHALRLGDHSDRPGRLMSSSRNRNTVKVPLSAEVQESNGYY